MFFEARPSLLCHHTLDHSGQSHPCSLAWVQPDLCSALHVHAPWMSPPDLASHTPSLYLPSFIHKTRLHYPSSIHAQSGKPWDPRHQPLPAPPFLIRQPPLLTLGQGHPWMLASLPVLPLLPHASGLPHTAVTARGPRRACCLLLLPDKGPGFPILHGQSHLHTRTLINLSALSTLLS